MTETGKLSFNRGDIVGTVAGFLFLMALTMPAWISALERPPLSYEQLPWRVHSPVSASDGIVEIEATRCNNRKEAFTYVVARTLVSLDNGFKVALPATITAIEPGCENIVSKLNVIPNDTPPGHYMLLGAGRVKGIVRDFDVPWSTQLFEVVP